MQMLKVGPNKKGGAIYFFGARHTNDFEDSQFELLKSLWDEFMASHKNDGVVFVESEVDDIPNKYGDAIRQYGEVGAASWLAKQAGSVVVCPEPNGEEQRKYLCESFDAQLVAYAFIVRGLSSWFKHKRESHFDDAVSQLIKREEGFSSVYHFVPNDVWFYSKHNEMFKNQPLSDKKFLDSISDPIQKRHSIINDIISSLSDMRNDFILEMINKFWRQGKSIFIVYGKGHLGVLRAGLENLAL